MNQGTDDVLPDQTEPFPRQMQYNGKQRVLSRMSKVVNQYKQETEEIYNIAQAPRLMKIDSMHHKFSIQIKYTKSEVKT